MPTMWEVYRDKFIKQPGYNTVRNFGVRIKDSTAQIGEYHWEVIGAHLLTPIENGGKQILAVDVVKDGIPIREVTHPGEVVIQWGWEGQRLDEKKDPIKLTKPIYEYGCDIAAHAGQVVWCRVLDKADTPSQTVEGFDTRQEGPGGGNSWGHWSIFVVLKYKPKTSGNLPLPDPDPEPDPDPDPEPPPVPVPGEQLTDAERTVLGNLTTAWRNYELLVEQNQIDKTAFLLGIHSLQRVILARPTWRQIND